MPMERARLCTIIWIQVGSLLKLRMHQTATTDSAIRNLSTAVPMSLRLGLAPAQETAKMLLCKRARP